MKQLTLILNIFKFVATAIQGKVLLNVR